MTIVNLNDVKTVGSASMQNGDFLTFDGLPNNKFSLIIPSLPNVVFFLQTFSLPEIRVNEIEIPTRFVDYNGIGEKLDYQPFQVSFLVDKYSRNWVSVFNWMKSMTVGGTNVDKTDDIVLMIDGKEFIRFMGAWPMTLTSYRLDSTVETFTYVTASVTFNYDYLEVLGQFATTDSAYTSPIDFSSQV